MSNTPPLQSRKPPAGTFPSWLIVVVMLAIVAFAWWQNNHAAQTKTVFDNQGSAVIVPDEDLPTSTELAPDGDQSSNEDSQDSAKTESGNSVTPVPKSLRPLNPNPDQKTNPVVPADKGRVTGPLSGMRQKPSTPTPPNPSPPESAKPASTPAARPADKSTPSEKLESTSLIIEKQTIRDLNGRIVYKGPIDLRPTLDRIERGEENRHRNDGTSFQNRENRLPRKPLGYYKEYVHPTKGEYGPGPQRIIIGKEGEVWYTPDHYKTFKKIK